MLSAHGPHGQVGRRQWHPREVVCASQAAGPAGAPFDSLPWGRPSSISMPTSHTAPAGKMRQVSGHVPQPLVGRAKQGWTWELLRLFPRPSLLGPWDERGGRMRTRYSVVGVPHRSTLHPPGPCPAGGLEIVDGLRAFPALTFPPWIGRQKEHGNGWWRAWDSLRLQWASMPRRPALPTAWAAAW